MALGILTSLLRGRLLPRKGLTALTTKRGPKGFYKGKGCKSTGRHTSKGGYVLMPEKLPIYVAPDLTDFKLKAYVAHDTPKVPKVEMKASSGGDASPSPS
jgi:large subunit ribosomal protein L41